MEPGDHKYSTETEKMVLIGRQEHFRTLREDRALDALITVLFEPEKILDCPQRVRQTSDAVVAILASVQSGHAEGFNQAIAMLSGRRITVDSDWIYDDLLAFSLAVGFLRFGGDTEFVGELLRARLMGGDDESRLMSESVGALLGLQKVAPLSSILVVGNYLAKPSGEVDERTLSDGFDQSLALEMRPSTQQFLRLIGEKVIELATKLSARSNSSDYARRVQFCAAFDKRARFFSHSVFWLLFFGVAALWLYIAGLYFSPDKATEELAGKLFQMGVVIGPLVLFAARKQMRGGLRRLFYLAFGGRVLFQE